MLFILMYMHSVKCDGTLFCCFLILMSTMRTWNFFRFFSSFTLLLSLLFHSTQKRFCRTLHSFQCMAHCSSEWAKKNPSTLWREKQWRNVKNRNVIRQRSTSTPFATFKWGFRFDVFLLIISWLLGFGYFSRLYIICKYHHLSGYICISFGLKPFFFPSNGFGEWAEAFVRVKNGICYRR